MIKEAINRILELSPIRIDDINGHIYTKDNLSRLQPPEHYEPEALFLHSLDGLLDYALGLYKTDDPNTHKQAQLQIVDYTKVKLIGPIDPNNNNRRWVYATASLLAENFNFGSWHKQDQFIIELMSKFIQTEQTRALLSMVACIKSVSERTDDDDGVTQRVEISQGLRIKEERRVENPVSLQPWRTFREVVQPESVFVIRLDGKRDRDQISVALVEADGAQWKLDAIENIKIYLESEMKARNANIGIIS